jgi:outer membrane protein TolC
LVIGVSIDFINQGIVIGGRSVDMWGPMARAVSSGLLVATVLTLVVVPVLYSFFDDIALFMMRIIPGMSPPEEQEATLVPDWQEDSAKEEDGEEEEEEEEAKTAESATDGAVGTVVVLVLSALIAAIGMGFPGNAFAQQPAENGASSPVVEKPAAGEEDEKFSTPKDVVEGDGFSREEQDKLDVRIDSARTLDLKQARELVRENSFDVRIAMTNIQVADATIAKAYTTLFPTFVARFQSNLYDSAIEADFASGFEDFGVESEPIIIRPQFDYNFTLNASMRLNAQAWPLLQQAYMNKELSQQQIAVIRDELEFAVVQTYYNTLLTRRVLDIAAERVASDRRQLRATEKRRAAGVAKPYELTRAKLRVTQSEQEFTRAMLSFEQLRSALAFLLQTEPDFDVVDVADLSLERDLPQLKKEALSQRPSVRIQSKVVELNEKGFQEIYWKYLPTMEVSAMALRPKGSAFSPGRWQYSLGLTAQWVLWDGGLREAELDERHAKVVAAKLEREKTKAQVHNELEQAWTEYLSTRTQLASSRTQVELAQDGLDEAERAYRLGAAQQLDVIFAQDQLRVTQLAVTQDELRVQLAIRKLLYLAGLD